MLADLEQKRANLEQTLLRNHGQTAETGAHALEFNYRNLAKGGPMRSLPLMRTEYWNLSTNTVRSGNTAHIESLTDVENYLLPQAQVGASSLYTWGVADGLIVSAVPTQPGVTIAPGVALDAAGHLIALAANGFAIVDANVDPNQVQNIPTVRVDPTGVVLSSAGLSGECFLTLTWREVLDPSQPANAPVLLHAPWLRLLGVAGFQDTGDQVILARVTLDPTGLVTGLAVEGRRLVGLPASRLELRRPRAVPVPALSVDHLPTAELRARAEGGLELNLLPLNSPPWPALTVGAAAGSLALAPQGGNVGIGTAVPAAGLDINRGATSDLALRLVSSGPNWGSGMQFSNTAVNAKTYGLYAGSDGKWHFADQDNHVDRLVIDQSGNLSIGIGASQAQRTLHVEGSEIHSGGPGGGFSFMNRGTAGFVNSPGAGERWVWYALGGSARLWSGGDKLTISPTGEGGGLDVARRMRVRQGGDGSAGIWFFQTGPQADRAFVGMSDDTHVGFWGNTGVGWGLVMDTSSGYVNIGGGLDVRSTGTAVSGHGGSGFFVSGVYGDGNLAMLANGTNTGIWAAGNGYGIVAASTGTAGQFFGSVNITGTLSKGGGGFKIDHPLDPANKYLSHSFVESPEMLNIYNGHITTDDHGEATVVLPDYFETLNRDFRYQLTPIGQMAQLAVIGEIRDNRFTIQTDKPGVTVSWQVTGVRQDPWANTHRITVEEAKPEAERSFYLHPEVHRQPETRSILAAQHGEEMLVRIRK
jgi:hypothetical protein